MIENEPLLSVTCMTVDKKLVVVDFPKSELIKSINAIRCGEETGEPTVLRIWNNAEHKGRYRLVNILLSPPVYNPTVILRLERN